MAALLFLMCPAVNSQNLVQNGSFEEYTDCPTSFGQWDRVVAWTSPYTQSADYFNACADSNVCSVPFNTVGYQYASDGEGYMGIATYATQAMGYYREIVASQLAQPLQPGVPVYCSFKVSPGGWGSNRQNSPWLTARAPGMNFFVELPSTSQPFILSGWGTYLFPNSAAIQTNTVLTDTSAWLNVSGVYVPDSAYQFLAIGNFFDNANSLYTVLDSGGWGLWNKAYAFIDDVCVSLDSSFCDVHVGLPGHVAVPSPAFAILSGNDLIVTGCGQLKQGIRLDLLDAAGRRFRSWIWPKSMSRWTTQLNGLAPGVYVLSATDPNGSITSMRLTYVEP